MAAWVWLVRDECPWHHMYADDVTGNLRAVTRAIADEYYATLDARGTGVRSAAAEHGRFRRGQRCEARVISQDLAALGEAFAEAWRRAPRTVDFPDIAASLRCAGRAAHAAYEGIDA